ncbi:AAA family ATPase [Loktanella sp. TSTF-M6]|uniref:non-specific protein-tyrosine kinase n=1 Tax=Loktanella gaetbuli TaxID=2881335 RepID=A0ABS8BY53_9RHOB|nr:AAA family ATPase [Loktanella gaetbuli]MCB5200666.1 AAA family ATPase [Loktanella gaetbuli]
MSPAPQNTMTAADQDTGKTFSILTILNTLWRGKWIIGVCALIGFLHAANKAYRVEVPTYRATTQMALNFDADPAALEVTGGVPQLGRDQSSFNTEMEIIRSRELIGRLVDRLDLTQDPEFNPALRGDPPFGLRDVPGWVIGMFRADPEPAPAAAPRPVNRNAVITRVRNRISTSIQRFTYVFSISAVSEDPRKAALLSNTLAEIYREDQIQSKVQGTEDAAIWLSDRVSELQAELETRQNEINELRARSALASPEAIAQLNSQSVAATSQLQLAELARTRAEDALARIIAVEDATPAEQVAALDDAQLRGLLARVQTGEATSQQRFDRRFVQLREQAEAEAMRAQNQITELQSQIDRLSLQFESQSADLITIEQLERETEATRILYETFLNRLRETSVQIGVQQADSRVLSEALWGSYVAPRKSRITFMGFLMGVLVGAGIVLGREMLQNTFRTAEELEKRTRLSVLGQIPRIPAKGRVPTIMYLANKPTSAAAESVRNLRTSLLMSDIDRPPQVIMMTSSLPAEGKTTTAIALAQNLAGLDKRVLLIEGDIRRRTFSAYFPDATERPGILSVIAQFSQNADNQRQASLEEAVLRNGDLGIDILMGEKSAINAADVFASSAFRDFMAQARTLYDYIIVDTPPVLVVPDARVIGPYADAVLYAVNWDKTSQTQVAEGLSQLAKANLRVTGLVLTQIDPRGMRRYGYGSKYGYGAYGGGKNGYYDN